MAERGADAATAPRPTENKMETMINVGALKTWDIPLAMCCPCCLGNPCQSHRRAWCLLNQTRVLIRGRAFQQFNSFLGMFSFVQTMVFLALLGDCKLGEVFHVPDGILVSFGAKDNTLIRQGQIIRLITPVLLHAGLSHLAIVVLAQVQLVGAANDLSQLCYGLQLERQWGWRRTLVIYFTSAVTGTLASLVVRWMFALRAHAAQLAPDSITAGGAGAVYGLIGANAAHIVCGWHLMTVSERRVTVLTIAIYFMIMTLFSISFEVDLATHIGGLVGGAALGFALFAHLCESEPLRRHIPIWAALFLFVYIAMCLGFTFQP